MSTVMTLEELSSKLIEVSASYLEVSARADRLEGRLELALSIIESLTSAHAAQVCASVDMCPAAIRETCKSSRLDEPVSQRVFSSLLVTDDSLDAPIAPSDLDASVTAADADIKVSSFPMRQTREEDMDSLDDGEEDVTCAVCLEVLVGSCTMTGCGHVFCAGCLVPWVQDHDKDEDVSCPCCRALAPATNPFVRARGVEELVRKWVMRRVARGPWRGLEDWRRKDQSWIIELRSNPLLSHLG